MNQIYFDIKTKFKKKTLILREEGLLFLEKNDRFRDLYLLLNVIFRFKYFCTGCMQGAR